ncbi:MULTISPECIES: hypothetical protein [Halobaculum]|uniref:Uncharacterized protein n=2 Tax=Halobaculum TaxID=43927 RepID=A0A8T8WG61_9EURY|nr:MULTISPECIES: hypothetical protein [Halobaculum]QZP38852.1 hypothetical protein K6T50_06870 [Halobaculum magnesiiphilum]QZY03837.1 hypothetical protein K6T36_06660 [Halobaculum roseum]
MLPVDGPSRADVLLALIGVSLLAAVVATVGLGVPFRLTAPAGSAVGGLAIADGVFRNPPTDG